MTRNRHADDLKPSESTRPGGDPTGGGKRPCFAVSKDALDDAAPKDMDDDDDRCVEADDDDDDDEEEEEEEEPPPIVDMNRCLTKLRDPVNWKCRETGVTGGLLLNLADATIVCEEHAVRLHRLGRCTKHWLELNDRDGCGGGGAASGKKLPWAPRVRDVSAGGATGVVVDVDAPNREIEFLVAQYAHILGADADSFERERCRPRVTRSGRRGGCGSAGVGGVLSLSVHAADGAAPARCAALAAPDLSVVDRTRASPRASAASGTTAGLAETSSPRGDAARRRPCGSLPEVASDGGERAADDGDGGDDGDDGGDGDGDDGGRRAAAGRGVAAYGAASRGRAAAGRGDEATSQADARPQARGDAVGKGGRPTGDDRALSVASDDDDDTSSASGDVSGPPAALGSTAVRAGVALPTSGGAASASSAGGGRGSWAEGLEGRIATAHLSVLTVPVRRRLRAWLLRFARPLCSAVHARAACDPSLTAGGRVGYT